MQEVSAPHGMQTSCSCILKTGTWAFCEAPRRDLGLGRCISPLEAEFLPTLESHRKQPSRLSSGCRELWKQAPAGAPLLRHQEAPNGEAAAGACDGAIPCPQVRITWPLQLCGDRCATSPVEGRCKLVPFWSAFTWNIPTVSTQKCTACFSLVLNSICSG